MKVTWFSHIGLHPRRKPLRALSLLCKSVETYVTMNPNMSIYRRLNFRLLVQVEMGLGLLYWANISNISLIPSLKLKVEA